MENHIDSRRAYLRGITDGKKSKEETDFDPFEDVSTIRNPFVSILERPKTTTSSTSSKRPRVAERSRETKNPIPWGGDDDDDDGGIELESIRTISPPPLRVADIALRKDAFALCLSDACGYCALSLADCFVDYPPEHIRRYHAYVPYLAPNPRAACLETETWIRKITKGARTLDDCIADKRHSDLYSAVAKVIGQYMRKHLMDNPMKTTHTKVASGFMWHDLTDALWSLRYELGAKWARSSYTVTKYSPFAIRQIKTGI